MLVSLPSASLWERCAASDIGLLLKPGFPSPSGLDSIHWTFNLGPFVIPFKALLSGPLLKYSTLVVNTPEFYCIAHPTCGSGTHPDAREKRLPRFFICLLSYKTDDCLSRALLLIWADSAAQTASWLQRYTEV